MGEIAEMMLDGTLCSCCGEYLGDDAGYPMTCGGCGGYEQDHTRRLPPNYRIPGCAQTPVFKVTKRVRARIERFGQLANNDAYHWQVRDAGRVVADWWPHKAKWRLTGQQIARGGETQFAEALAKAAAQ